MAQCRKKKRDGNRCRGKARSGSSFCLFHDPAMAERQQASRSAGGKQRSKPAAVLPADTNDLPLATVQDCAAMLGQTINHVRKGQLDPRIGNCLAVLTAQLLRALEEGEIQQLAARVAELESRLQQRLAQRNGRFTHDDHNAAPQAS